MLYVQSEFCIVLGSFKTDFIWLDSALRWFWSWIKLCFNEKITLIHFLSWHLKWVLEQTRVPKMVESKWNVTLNLQASSHTHESNTVLLMEPCLLQSFIRDVRGHFLPWLPGNLCMLTWKHLLQRGIIEAYHKSCFLGVYFLRFHLEFKPMAYFWWCRNVTCWSAYKCQMLCCSFYFCQNKL